MRMSRVSDTRKIAIFVLHISGGRVLEKAPTEGTDGAAPTPIGFTISVGSRRMDRIAAATFRRNFATDLLQTQRRLVTDAILNCLRRQSRVPFLVIARLPASSKASTSRDGLELMHHPRTATAIVEHRPIAVDHRYGGENENEAP